MRKYLFAFISILFITSPSSISSQQKEISEYQKVYEEGFVKAFIDGFKVALEKVGTSKQNMNRETKGKTNIQQSDEQGNGKYQATTKNETRCKKKPTPGSKYCFQHGG